MKKLYVLGLVLIVLSACSSENNEETLSDTVSPQTPVGRLAADIKSGKVFENAEEKQALIKQYMDEIPGLKEKVYEMWHSVKETKPESARGIRSVAPAAAGCFPGGGGGGGCPNVCVTAAAFAAAFTCAYATATCWDGAGNSITVEASACAAAFGFGFAMACTDGSGFGVGGGGGGAGGGVVISARRLDFLSDEVATSTDSLLDDDGTSSADTETDADVCIPEEVEENPFTEYLDLEVPFTDGEAS